MFKTTKRRASHNNHIDISADLYKIKSALGVATFDVKNKIAEMLSQSLENAKDLSEITQKQTAKYITKKPMKALGFVALGGIIIGYLLHR
jgi:ElaB/YqjD/DUF883 family membrane-anchored ribosome-binding protein